MSDVSILVKGQGIRVKGQVIRPKFAYAPKPQVMKILESNETVQDDCPVVPSPGSV